jgi:hypothetical protein
LGWQALEDGVEDCLRMSAPYNNLGNLARLLGIIPATETELLEARTRANEAEMALIDAQILEWLAQYEGEIQ